MGEGSRDSYHKLGTSFLAVDVSLYGFDVSMLAVSENNPKLL